MPILALFFTIAKASCAPPDELRRRIAETFFVPSVLPALRIATYGTFEPVPGVVAERISYGTEFGMRIPAILYRPAHPSVSKAPAMVVVNGHGGDKYSWYSPWTGMLYAKAAKVNATASANPSRASMISLFPRKRLAAAWRA
jgi:hypothetical protein